MKDVTRVVMAPKVRDGRILDTSHVETPAFASRLGVGVRERQESTIT